MRAGEHTPAVEARRLWRGGGEGGCRWGGGERRETLRWLRHITVIVSHRERRECEVVRCREVWRGFARGAHAVAGLVEERTEGETRTLAGRECSS